MVKGGRNIEHTEILSLLPGALLPWYRQSHRELPWRQTRDPYRIWLSEIMLQQTRVEAVKGYYTRFLEALPTVEALSRCDDDTLHKLWEGLGYYSRVRNLKKAAQVIITEYGGIFPGEYEKILALPGVGAYTAGAIGSIAFGLRTPAVDGNVLRVVSRLLNDPTPIDLPAHRQNIRQLLSRIYPEEAGDFTQALMELGATLCGPNRKPACGCCPCREFCLGNQLHTAQSLPVKSPKKQRRTEERTVFLLSCGDLYALEKRPGQGLLAGLWQFPNVAGTLDLPQAMEAVAKMGLTPVEIRRQVEKKHIFTHITWSMRGFYIETAEPGGDFIWQTAQQINTLSALPTAFRQFWEDPIYV